MAGVERSVWVPAENVYKSMADVQTCKHSMDCPGVDEVCAKHNWGYNNQFESMTGCWHKSVCKNEMGSQSFEMFDGRRIQWFCDRDAHEKANGNYGWTGA